MRHVIAVANVGEMHAAQIAEVLLQGQHVGHRLAGMLQFAESIDHRNGRMLRHGGDGLVRKRAQHDAVDPALQVVRHVAQALASAQARLRLIDEERGSRPGC